MVPAEGATGGHGAVRERLCTCMEHHTALSVSYSPLIVKVADGTSETLSYQPPKQEVLTQSTSLSEMFLSFATDEVLNTWWSGNTKF